MTITIDIFDAITSNEHTLSPDSQVAGYTTGAGIAWTAQQFANHTKPHPAVRIDQDPNATDPTADVLDVERGAATVAEIPGWLTLARASFHAGTRPGQRWPAIYCSLNTLDSAIQMLEHGGFTDCPFAIAELTNRGDAINKVSSASGPFPRIWHQYRFGNTFDSGIASVPWLTNVSGTVATTPEIPPGQWNNPNAWTWKDAEIIGIGLDGRLHSFTFDPDTGQWTKTS